ncbi:MAG: hypothetical protein ACP5K9_00540 [Candidatus Micrarchaeia archaeon]
MVKVYKQKDKLVIYLPFDVVDAFHLKENDEVDFFRYSQNAFLFAKKSDVASILMGKQPSAEQQKGQFRPQIRLSDDEIMVLKKLDTLRYNARSKEAVEKMLNESEKKVLGQLEKKNAVSLFKDSKSGSELYSISKSIYDSFLMRKRQIQGTPKPEQVQPAVPQYKRVEQRGSYAGTEENENVKELESKGFVVIASEAEASSLSLALEESIRQGMVLGTRAFNKKFYIVMRQFFDRYGSKFLKELEKGAEKVTDIAAKYNVDEEGARAVLYLLAESGDVSEIKKDMFELA